MEEAWRRALRREGRSATRIEKLAALLAEFAGYLEAEYAIGLADAKPLHLEAFVAAREQAGVRVTEHLAAIASFYQATRADLAQVAFEARRDRIPPSRCPSRTFLGSVPTS